MNVIFQTRDFSANLAELPIAYTVERFSHNAIGGPKLTTIHAAGDPLDLWQLMDRLRCPVEVYSDLGDCVWWGYVAQVEVVIGGLKIGVSIDEMYNSVAVAYENIPSGSLYGSRATTGFVVDSDSSNEYGTRELLYSSSVSTSTHAEAARAAILAQKKLPQPCVISQVGDEPARATILCRGWWDTLDWLYYDNQTGYHAYTDSGTGDQAFGNATATKRVGQSFQLPNRWKPKQVLVNIKKVGTPADSAKVWIYTDADGGASTLLYSGTLAAASIADSYAWHTFTMTGSASLAPNTTYWILVGRTGAVDADNYYVVDVNEDLGYAAGAFKIENDDTWVDRDPDADMLFRIEGSEDTGSQLKVMLDTGQFFADVELAAASGIEVSQYRFGDNTALVEAEELLEMGTSNQKRLLVSMDQHRRVRIYEEPAATSPYLLSKSGAITDPFDTAVRKEAFTAGVWLKLKDIIPATLDTSTMADPSLIFVEEVEYTVASDRLRFTPRGVTSPWELGNTRDG